jgi:capsular exopolysaccharide synthesis family protein
MNPTEPVRPEGHGTAPLTGGGIHLKDYFRVLWAGRWIVVACFVLITTLAAISSFLADDVYQAQTIISLDTRNNTVIQNQLTSAPNWFELQRYMNEQERILRSRKLGERIVKRLRLDEHPSFKGSRDAASAFIGGIQVRQQRDSNIFTISIEGRNPKELAEWANSTVEEYKRLNIEENFERARDLQKVILEKLDPFQKVLQKSEEDWAKVKSATDQFYADGSKSVVGQRLDKLTEEYTQAQAERIATESRMKGVQGLLEQGLPLESYPEVLSNPVVQALNAQRTKAEIEMSEAKKIYKEGHPKVRELRAEIDEVSVKIRSEIGKIINSIRSEYNIRKAREDALFQSIQSNKEEAITTGQKIITLDKIRREYEQNKAFYEQMLQRLKEADISGSVAVNNVRVIEPALPPAAPIRPKRRMNVMLAGLGSLLFGIGIVFFLDYLDQSIKYPEDIERHLGLAVLTTIPRYTPERVRAIRELYQTMRTSLIFSRLRAGPQTVIVTSSGPGEGKTTTSFNLAKILSAAGDKVVLVDCDLRRPSVHKHISVQNSKGITSYIFQQASLPEILRPTDSDNFKVITSGPLPPNPPEMFGKREFGSLLEELKERFDWVILDTPPVASVTDPVIICPYADMLVLVIRYNNLDRKVITSVLKALSSAKARIIGAVLNNIDVDRDSYYSTSYYYYYYRSGYYGEDAGTEKKTAKLSERARAAVKKGPAPSAARREAPERPGVGGQA